MVRHVPIDLEIKIAEEYIISERKPIFMLKINSWADKKYRSALEETVSKRKKITEYLF